MIVSVLALVLTFVLTAFALLTIFFIRELVHLAGLWVDADGFTFAVVCQLDFVHHLAVFVFNAHIKSVAAKCLRG